MRSSSRWRVVWLQWIKRLLTVPSWPWRFGWIFQHRKIKTIKIFKIIFQTFWLLRVAQLTVQCIVSPVYNIWWQKMILLPQLCSHLEFEWQKTSWYITICHFIPQQEILFWSWITKKTLKNLIVNVWYLFVSLSLKYLFLDCANSQESVNEAFLLLSVTPNPGHGLFVVSRIPIWVKHDQPVGTDQVQSAAACFAINKQVFYFQTQRFPDQDNSPSD